MRKAEILDPERAKRLFQKLLRIAPHLRETVLHAKSRVPHLMDLGLDVLVRRGHFRRIALSHYWKHPSGDLIPDPDMEIAVFFDEDMAEALTYQDAYGYQEALFDEGKDADPRIRQQLNEFLEIWLDNLAAQGHVLPLNKDR